MPNSALKRLSSLGIAIALSTTAFLSSSQAFAADAQIIEQGQKLAFDRKKGNCLACHKIEGGSMPGNIGPELKNMKDRFPDKSKLRAQIYDAQRNNPNTMMPPFGRHEILSKDEIDKVVEYIYSL